MESTKNHLLFLADNPEKYSGLIKKLYELDGVMVLRINNMCFEQIRGFLLSHRSCIILFLIEKIKGPTVSLLRDIYSCSFNVPYIVVLFKMCTFKFLKNIKSYDVSKLFCIDSEGYSDDLVVDWIKKASCCLSMSCVFPFSGSYSLSSVKFRISDKLQKMGMLNYLTGYSYVVDAIEMYMQNENLCITRDIYKTLAERYETTCMGVDRCMRHAIEVVWRDTELERLKEHYPDISKVYKNRPSVLEFVSCIAKSLSQESV